MIGYLVAMMALGRIFRWWLERAARYWTKYINALELLNLMLEFA